MSQRLTTSNVSITITAAACDMSPMLVMDAELAEATRQSIETGEFGWSDLTVSVAALGFTGKAYLSAVSYRAAQADDDLTEIVRDGLIDEALTELVGAADHHGWEIVLSDQVRAEIRSTVKPQIELA